MGQLAGRLRELIRLHVGPGAEEAWRDELDAIDALEGTDAKRAHERFLALRVKLVEGHARRAHAELREFPWLAEVPDLVLEGCSEREIGREIDALERAGAQARALVDALDEARASHATLSARRVSIDLAPFERVTFDELEARAREAEALRRRVARERTLEQRHAQASSRAVRLAPVRVDVPDVSLAKVADPEAAARLLDGVEGALDHAQRVNDAYARVQRALKDAAVRKFLAQRAEDVSQAALAATRTPEAVKRLDDLASQAEALRAQAAALASQAARARKRGARGPEPERRRGDLQDYYG